LSAAAQFAEIVLSLVAQFHCSETSGVRTPARNARVGGAKRSRHLLQYGKGLARDLVPDDNTVAVRQALVREAKRRGLWALDEGDHVHVDGRYFLV
jgi:hypothetical protein